MKTVVKIGNIQWVIIILTLVTAVIHLVLPGVIMKLNALGYLGLLAAYFLELPVLKGLKRDMVRLAFVGYTAVTILAYFASWGLVEGLQQPLGVAAKIVELALVVFLLRDR